MKEPRRWLSADTPEARLLRTVVDEPMPHAALLRAGRRLGISTALLSAASEGLASAATTQATTVATATGSTATGVVPTGSAVGGSAVTGAIAMGSTVTGAVATGSAVVASSAVTTTLVATFTKALLIGMSAGSLMVGAAQWTLSGRFEPESRAALRAQPIARPSRSGATTSSRAVTTPRDDATANGDADPVPNADDTAPNVDDTTVSGRDSAPSVGDPASSSDDSAPRSGEDPPAAPNVGDAPLAASNRAEATTLESIGSAAHLSHAGTDRHGPTNRTETDPAESSTRRRGANGARAATSPSESDRAANLGPVATVAASASARFADETVAELVPPPKASTSAAPQVPPIPPRQASSLASEVRALDSARSALRTGQAKAALEALDQAEKRGVFRVLDREAAVLRVEALGASGQRARAAALAKRLLRGVVTPAQKKTLEGWAAENR